MNKIKEYQVTDHDFEDLQKELGDFYNLPLHYSNQFDDDDIKQGKAIGTPRVATSYGDMMVNIIDLHNLSTLARIITKNAEDYLGDTNFKIVDCWATDMQEGSAALWHNHKPTMLSGVYYHEFTEPESRIEFKINDVATPFESKLGKMMIWPAETLHRIPLKTTSTKRRSISFNVNRLEETIESLVKASKNRVVYIK
jgi:hypothetical protein